MAMSGVGVVLSHTCLTEQGPAGHVGGVDPANDHTIFKGADMCSFILLVEYSRRPNIQPMPDLCAEWLR